MDVLNAPAETMAGLADIRLLSLKELLSGPGGSVLDHSLRTVVVRAEEHPQKSVSAFNSAV